MTLTDSVTTGNPWQGLALQKWVSYIIYSTYTSNIIFSFQLQQLKINKFK